MNEKRRNEFNVYTRRRTTIIRGAGGKRTPSAKTTTCKNCKNPGTGKHKHQQIHQNLRTCFHLSWCLDMGKHVYTPQQKLYFNGGMMIKHDKTAFFRTHKMWVSDRFAAGLGALCGWKSLCGTAAPWSLLPERGPGNGNGVPGVKPGWSTRGWHQWHQWKAAWGVHSYGILMIFLILIMILRYSGRNRLRQ